MISPMALCPWRSSLFVFLIWLFNCLNILREYERAVVFRLGRVLKKEKGPGLVLIFWPIDKIVKVSLRVVTWDVPPQDVITRDNVSLKVNAVVYFRVINATKAIIEVENFRYAVEQAAQTSLRSVLGEVELDDLLSQREKLNARLQTILDEHTEAWGVKVTQVQVKQVDLPQEMQRAIAAQAEAERERRAKIISAEGEFQAAAKLAEAAAVLEPRAGGHHAALSADADRDRHREEHDDRVPAAARSARRARQAGGERRAAFRGLTNVGKRLSEVSRMTDQERALHQHDPHAVDRCGAEGELRPSRACRWAPPRWPTSCGHATSGTIRRTRRGRTATASCCPPGTPACCSTACCS